MGTDFHFTAPWERSPREDLDQDKSQAQQSEPCLNPGANSRDNKSEGLKQSKVLLIHDLGWKQSQELSPEEEPAVLVKLGTIPVSIPRGSSRARGIRAELIKIDPRNAAKMSLGPLSDG